MNSTKSPRILLVVTSHDRFGETGKKTGYYLPEVSHPVARFRAAGFDVDFASPKGGEAPVDPASVDRNDADNRALLDDATLTAKLRSTKTPDDVRLAVANGEYDAIFFAGGMGTMWDFAQDARLGDLASDLLAQGKVVAAVCHGPAALLSAKRDDGRWLVEGHTVAGFSNAEETAAGHDGTIPYHLETELAKRGATYVSAPVWQAKVVTSGRLVTGQNPASAKGVADAVVSLLAPARAPAERAAHA
ncbi:MAG: type 1 glutamine amidotransferase domain-containing protein [Polyangiaceae bacterium]